MFLQLKCKKWWLLAITLNWENNHWNFNIILPEIWFLILFSLQQDMNLKNKTKRNNEKI